LPYEACVLGSVNLAHMVRQAESGAEVDWHRLRHTVRVGVRFLDDVIEVNRFPLRETAAIVHANRKIGLGVMGFAECLVRLGVSYDSDEAVAYADRLMACIATEARAASVALAEERGVFPNWGRSTHAASGERLRNATVLSVAPTGTISMVAGTTSGIEPLFALAYRRTHTLGGEAIAELNPVFARHAAAHDVDLARVLPQALATGSLRTLRDVPEAARRVFVTATEIAPVQHLRIQQAFQRHTDNAVSKTINLPEDARRVDVADAYLTAWRLGLKGITVYRYGSKGSQVLSIGAYEDTASRELFVKCDPGACRL